LDTEFSFSLNDTGDHRLLIVDDLPDNVTMLSAHLRARGYTTLKAYGGTEALRIIESENPDLVLLDVDMPDLNGLEVCRRLKLNPKTRMLPVILVTAHSETNDILKGFETGADDYLIKPFNYTEMLARVRSMLRIRDTQMMLMRVNSALEDLNRNLEQKVADQVQELASVNRLRRFFSPQLVNSIVAGKTDILRSHRSEITVVFLDLRRFTDFAETATPDEVIMTIREMHEAVGPVIFEYKGTLERFTGDGIMVFLGDPEPMPDHAMQAVSMAKEIQNAVETLREKWLAKGYPLGLGIGICTGVASLGTIGFEGRLDYAAIGSVTNLAARLCGRADGGQILVSQSTHDALDASIETRPHGEIDLKGFSAAQHVYEIVR
jgi:class 3 adenylate cyclase